MQRGLFNAVTLLTARPEVEFPTLLDRVLPWRWRRLQQQAEAKFVSDHVARIAPFLCATNICQADIRNANIK